MKNGSILGDLRDKFKKTDGSSDSFDSFSKHFDDPEFGPESDIRDDSSYEEDTMGNTVLLKDVRDLDPDCAETMRESSSERRTVSASAHAATSSSGTMKKNRDVYDSRMSRPSGRLGRNSSARKKQSAKYRMIKFFVFLFLWICVAVMCYVGYSYTYKIFNDMPVDASNVSKISVTITGTETNDEMAQMLYSLGLIDSVKMYKTRCKLYAPEYVEGTYKLSKSYNTEKIMNILSGVDYSDGTIEE